MYCQIKLLALFTKNCVVEKIKWIVKNEICFNKFGDDGGKWLKSTNPQKCKIYEGTRHDMQMGPTPYKDKIK